MTDNYPDEYTEKTRLWLEERFQRGVKENKYFAHRPIYGFGVQPSERHHTARMALALAILRVLNLTEGHSFADLGGGEGYIAALARDILGYEPLLFELPESACQRARELFGVPAIAGDIHKLPFADESVDVTVISEVIEHLADPILALAEAWRVTRNVLVVTTQEAYPWEWERTARMRLRDLSRDHAERTLFHPDDFRALFGDKIKLLNPCMVFPLNDETRINVTEARKVVPNLARTVPFGPASLGVMVVVPKRDGWLKEARKKDSILVDKLFRFSVLLPNVIQARNIPLPEWIQLRDKKAGDHLSGENRYLPLADRWSERDRRRLEQLRMMQEQPVASSPIERIFWKIMLLAAGGLRFLQVPGKWSEKLSWLLRTLRPETLKKIAGG